MNGKKTYRTVCTVLDREYTKNILNTEWRRKQHTFTKK